MLVREGELRTAAIDLRLAALLSFVAGGLNAAGFQAAGLFSANMTGNVSALADHLANGAFGVALLLTGIVGVFILGAFLSGVAIQIGTRRRLRAIYAMIILAEAAILRGLALATIVIADPARDLAMSVVLSFVLGMQNAATTQISRARVRTTHISGMATDIGLELAGLMTDGAGRTAYGAALALHLSTILAFLLGGVLGALGFILTHGGVFAAAALILVAIAAPEAFKARRTAAG